MKSSVKKCESETEQLKMMNSGLRMVVEQTEGKTKTEVSELKQQLQHAESTAQQAMAGRNLDMLYLISNHIFKVMCLSVNP